MTRPRLTTFGESLLRLSTPIDQPLETTDGFDVYVGGAEGNVAVAAQRLGIDATWVSKLPDTPLGAKITATYRSHGVDPAVVWSADGRVGTYYLERGTEPRGSRVVYDRADAAITTATHAQLPDEPFTETDALHVTGITPALSETLEETTRTVLEAASEHNVTTTFDLNYRANLWSESEAAQTLKPLLELVDVLFVAQRDAADVLGYDGDAETVASDLSDDFDCELVVLTRGEEGALAFDGTTTEEQPVIPTETTDAIGSGDAFVGGFLAAWLDDRSVPAALEWGAATAALKRTMAGDLAIVGPDMVESVLAEDSGAIDR